jgi:hypothetical protein
MATPFNPNILDRLRNVTDTVLKTVQKSGVLLYARHNVRMVKRNEPHKINAYGFQGQYTDTITVMDPQPSVDLRDQYRQRDGIVINVGDARLFNIPQTYTKQDLIDDVDFFLIDDVEYDIVQGTLKDQQSGIFWEVIIKRREAKL